MRRLIKFAKRLIVFTFPICLFTQLIPPVHAGSAASGDRFMRNGVLISQKDPSLAIKVNDNFKFVGRHSFTIRDVAAGVRFVFVDAGEQQQIKRMFIVQFEGFLPGIDNFYRYNLTGSPVIVGYPFRSDGYAYNIIKAIEENPQSESAATYPFLKSKGFSIPDEWVQWRSLTIADQALKKELILFYAEDLKSTGLSLDDFYEQDRPTDAWFKVQKGLKVRAHNSFRLAELSADGEPVASSWMKIPVE